MSEHKPRMTFWGERVETEPQGFKQMLRAREAAAKLAAEKAKEATPDPEPEPVKRKYTRHTEE